MKTRFNSYDVVCITAELQKLVGLRVNQIYDIDNKTYLIKLQDKDVKQTLLMESGIRFHTTAFEWPKNPSPSGFTMKLRKHLKNKRLESLKQLGTDRIIDFQFGVGDATYHLILELYDRGNLILCDHEMTILNVLRPHTEGEEVRFVVREKYPEARARENSNQSSEQILREALANIKSDDSLMRALVPVLDCGPTVLMHTLYKRDLHDVKVKKNVTDENGDAKENEAAKGKNKKKKEPKNDASVRYFDESKDFQPLVEALDEAREFMKNLNRNDDSPHGFIIQKIVEKPSAAEGAGPEEFYYNTEYHPYLFDQYTKLWKMKYKEFPTFDAAVDEFYSTLIGQKIDLKTYQQECEALKKLSNVKKDHEKRLEELTKAQVLNKQRAELISRNHELINSVLVTMRSAIANQMSWDDIKDFVKNAQQAGDYVANSIKQLKLETNHVALYLTDPYATLDDDGDANSEDNLPPMVVDIDLGLSAYANATRYYDQKRSAANKETRTKDASTKALKNAERKTQEHLKEVRTISNISKARKVFWFEKFYWFISSENYLVIGGRDQQQNELIVKRYLRPNDIYVHADIQGASSIVIRNPYTGNASDPQAAIPPKTLLEAGAMAISYSVAWDAKITTSAYWVRAEQVSKTAPTGEYLETGSFMIRGKKNFLPPCHLILGLSIMFKLEESSIPRHAGERCVRTFDDDSHKKYELETEEESVQSVDLNQADDTANAEDNESSSTESDDDGPGGFPDTHIKIGSLSTQVSADSTVDRISESVGSSLNIAENDGAEEEGAIIHAAPQQMPRKNRVIQKAKGNKKQQQQQKQQQHQQKQREEEEKMNQKSKSGSALKRGQKSKLKKIKEKYKDQDEEEKQMRMEILKSAGNRKPETPTKEADQPETDRPKRNPAQGEKKPQQSRPKEPAAGEAGAELDAGDDDEAQGDTNDTDMLNSLTGCPSEEDELLFALPVVAPYNALHSYKYKVKITPGTGRRGKTSKTAFQMFLKEKGCSNAEKDLIKAIKPDTAARNMPGKVKLSAPQMQRLRN